MGFGRDVDIGGHPASAVRMGDARLHGVARNPEEAVGIVGLAALDLEGPPVERHLVAIYEDFLDGAIADADFVSAHVEVPGVAASNALISALTSAIHSCTRAILASSRGSSPSR